MIHVDLPHTARWECIDIKNPTGRNAGRSYQPAERRFAGNSIPSRYIYYEKIVLIPNKSILSPDKACFGNPARLGIRIGNTKIRLPIRLDMVPFYSTARQDETLFPLLWEKRRKFRFPSLTGHEYCPQWMSPCQVTRENGRYLIRQVYILHSFSQE